MTPTTFSSASTSSHVNYPTSLGYFLQDGLESHPYEVNKNSYQLDEELIKEINSTEGYQLRGELVNFQAQNGHAQTFSNTDILENFIAMKKGPSSGKLRIFARGGALCDFLTAATRTNVTSLYFDYDQEKNLIRLNKALDKTHNRAFAFTKIGEKRLIGCKDPVIVFGKTSIYRAFEIIHPDYELYYTKEVEGFYGDDPVEIRGVIKDKKCLSNLKMLCKDVAMGGISKVVVIIAEEDLHTVERVTLIDTFDAYDRNDCRSLLFNEVQDFFGKHLKILKRLEEGYISKGMGGTIIRPKRSDTRQKAMICGQKLESSFYKKFCLDEERAGEMGPSMFSHQDTDLFLCFNNLSDVVEMCEGDYNLSAVQAIFVEDWKLPFWNNEELGERTRTQKDHEAITHHWRRIIKESHPELLLPVPLCTCNTHVFVPTFYKRPNLDGLVRYDDPFCLSSKTTFATVEQLYDLNRMLDHTMQNGGPFPELVPDMRLNIYTWADPVACEMVLKDFFEDKITFEEPEIDAPVICCHIEQLPRGDLFEDAFYKTMGLEIPIDIGYQAADLYLVEDGSKVDPYWENKYDLRLTSNFKGFDRLRKFPNKIALFGNNVSIAAEIEDILRPTHVFVTESSNPWLFVRR